MKEIKGPGPEYAKYCPECITVWVGKAQRDFKYCPKCALKVYDVKVVQT
jgi:hypothetical protein